MKSTPQINLTHLLQRGGVFLSAHLFVRSAVRLSATLFVALFVSAFPIVVVPTIAQKPVVVWWIVVGVGVVAFVISDAAKAFYRRRKRYARARFIEELMATVGVSVPGAVQNAQDFLDDDANARRRRSPSLVDAYIADVNRRVRPDLFLGAFARYTYRHTRYALVVALLPMFVLALLVRFAPSQMSAVTGRMSAVWAHDDGTSDTVRVPPVVKDLTITLNFPPYMKRDPETSRGASGSLSAPIGTNVSVRATPRFLVRGATLLVGADRIPMQLNGATSTIDGAFVVKEASTYRFSLEDVHGEVHLSPTPHTIRIEADLHPAVELFAPIEDAVVELDDEITVRARAKDDYGITRARALVVRGHDPPFVKDLGEIASDTRTHHGTISFRVEEIGAEPGDTLSVYVEAYDNNDVTGPQVGRSTTRVLTVFSPIDHHRKVMELEERVLDALLAALAPELLFPPNETDSSVPDHLNAITTAAKSVLLALDDVLEVLDTDELSEENVLLTLRNMRAQLATPTTSLDDTSAFVLPRRFRDARAAVNTLVPLHERFALYLDDLLSTQKLDELSLMTEEIARTERSLRALLDEYKKNPDDAVRERLRAEIAKMNAQVENLMQRMASIERESSSAYVNQAAIQNRERRGADDDLDTLIEEGKIDDAIAALDAMREATEEMRSSLNDDSDKFGDEHYSEMREKLAKFTEELDAIEQKQNGLLHETNQMMQSAHQKMASDMAGKLTNILAELLKSTQTALEKTQSVVFDSLYPREQENIAVALAEIKDTRTALELKNLDDAAGSAATGASNLAQSETSLLDRTLGRYGSTDKALSFSSEKVREARVLMESVRDALDQLLPDPMSMLSENEQRQVRGNQKAQQELRERMKALDGEMQKLGKEAPLFGPSHQASMKRAARSMEGADGALGRGQLAEGRRAQQSAQQALHEMKTSMEQAGANKGTGGMPMPVPSGGDGRARSGDGGNGKSSERVLIPELDDGVPKRLRQDVMDAMKEKAPSTWEPEVKGYYRELVK